MPQVETSDPQKSAQNMALFVECVTMYAHQAMIAMGKVVNPMTKKAERNLDAARLFIDMLEMLEAKTKGNLSREEERLLQSSLGSLRLTYVEEAQSPEANQQASASAPTEGQEPAAKSPETPAAEPQKEEENKKKFSKKYD